MKLDLVFRILFLQKFFCVFQVSSNSFDGFRLITQDDLLGIYLVENCGNSVFLIDCVGVDPRCDVVTKALKLGVTDALFFSFFLLFVLDPSEI